MLCCFRAPQTAESPQEASRPPPPKVVDPVKASSLNDANTEAPAGQHVPAPAETAISEHKALVLDGATASIPESWRFRLQQHITELIALRGFSAASCWVLEDGGNSVLVASFPQPALSVARAATSKHSLGSIISNDSSEPSGVALVLASHEPYFATVQPGCEHLADLPADLEALYQQVLLARVPSLRLCGPGLVPAPVTPRNVQLAALPLVARQDGSVAGVLVLAATDDRLARAESRRRRGSPANSGDNCGGGSAAGTDVNSMMKEVADEVAANFFGSKESRSSAGQVCSMALALAGGGDHASAVRAAASGVHKVVHAALPPAAPPVSVTLGLVLSRSAGGGGGNNGSPSTPLSGAVHGGSGSGSASVSASASGSAAAALQRSLGAAGAPGPQLQLYCTPAGKPPALMPLMDTLLLRAPQAHQMAPAAALPAPSPGPMSAKRQFVLSCGDAGVKQGGELPADLAALAAAGVELERSSLVVVSCPLPNILCAVVAYASVATAAGERQPSEAELACVRGHLESATELLAACMEQRLLATCGPALVAPGVRGALGAAVAAGSSGAGAGRAMSALDVAGDPSGQLTLSMAGVDGDESGAWGSASGPILSTESLPTSTQVASSALITGSASKAASNSAVTPAGIAGPTIAVKQTVTRVLHTCAHGADPTAPGVGSAAAPGTGAATVIATSHTGSTTASACASTCLGFGSSRQLTINSITTSTAATAFMTGSSNAVALASLGSKTAAGGACTGASGSAHPGSSTNCRSAPLPECGLPTGVVLATQQAAAASTTAAAASAAAATDGAAAATDSPPAPPIAAPSVSTESSYCSGSLTPTAGLLPAAPVSAHSLLPSFASAGTEAATVTSAATAFGNTEGDDKDDEEELMETAHSYELCVDVGNGNTNDDLSTGIGNGTTSEYDVRPRSLDVPTPLDHRLQGTGAATAPPVAGSPGAAAGCADGAAGDGPARAVAAAQMLMAADKYDSGGGSGLAIKGSVTDSTKKLQQSRSARIEGGSGGGGAPDPQRFVYGVPLSAPMRLTASGASVVLTRTPPAALYRSPQPPVLSLPPASGGSLGALGALDSAAGSGQPGRAPLLAAAAVGMAGEPQATMSTIAASASAGAARPPLGPLDPTAPPQLRLGGSSAGGLAAGSGAGSSAGGSGALLPVFARCRSKDWSDQATEDPADSHALSGMRPLTGTGRFVKVLSLDKAALQLPRAQVSVMQPLASSSPTPPPEQRDAVPSDRDATASGAAASPAPQGYTRYAPRRLTRMYLPGAGAVANTAAASAIGSGACAGSVGSGVMTGASEGGWPDGWPQTRASTRPYDHAAGEDAGKGLSSWARLPGTLPGTAAGMVHHPPYQQGLGQGQGLGQVLPAAAAAFVAQAPPPAADAAQPHPGVVVPVAVPPARVYLPSALQSTLAPPQSAAPAAPTLPMQLPRTYTPFSKTAAGAAAAAAAAAAAHAAATSSAASAAAAKGRQLADYVIPEDAPLEYTVSETVAMMRMLSRARGVHLSARMRRVRVTAKIQSAHPDALPADLPSQLAKAAAAAGATAGAGGGGVAAAAAPGTWVLTGVAARRGCVELVFDMVQMLPPSPPRSPGVGRGGRSRRPPSGSNGYVSYSAAQATAAPAAAGMGSGLGYRRWQGAGTEVPADPLFSSLVIGPGHDVDSAASTAWQQLNRVLHGPANPSDAAAAAAAAGTGGLRAGDERAWLGLGLRPEAVGAALHQCGLLDSAADPFVDVQVGTDPAGAVRLAWDAAANQWAAAAPAQPGAAGAPEPAPAPTLWLPMPVVVCGRGAAALTDVRVLCCSSDSEDAAGAADELTVRTAAGFLPVRVESGVCAPNGAASSLPLHPADAANDLGAALVAAAGGQCRLQLVEVGVAGAGAALPASGGLLLVECRRGLTTSAPVPLLVLTEQEAAAAAELAGLRGAMACLLHGSEGAARAAPTPEARAELAAGVEMAAQQFLTDLGTLLDAAAAASASAGGGACESDSAAPMDGAGLCSFNDDMRRLMAVRPEAGGSNHCSAAHAAPLSVDGSGSAGSSLTHSPVATSTGSSATAFAAAAAGTTPYGEHLTDLACTLLAGCCAAGMLSTAALVLRAACVELGLTAPEVLLAEAGASPRVTVELLTAFVVASRARSSVEINRAAAAAADGGACSGGAPPAGAVVDVTSHAAAVGAEPAEWSTATATEAAGGGDGASLSISLTLGTALLPGRGCEVRSLAEMASISTIAGDDTPRLAAGPSTSTSGMGFSAGAGDGDEAMAPGQQPRVIAVAARALSGSAAPGAAFSRISELPTWDSLASMSGNATGGATGVGAGSASSGDGNAGVGSRRTSMSLTQGRASLQLHSTAPSSAAAVSPSPTSRDSKGVPSARASSVLTAAAAVAAVPVMAAADAHSDAVLAAQGEHGEDADCAGPSTCTSQPGSARTSNTGSRARLMQAAELLTAAAAGKGQEGALALALLQHAAAQAGGTAAARSSSECGGGGDRAAAGGSAGVTDAAGGSVGPVAGASAAPPSWSLRFSDPGMEAEYWNFVADRTCGMMWIYSLLVGFITVISCTRALVEDGVSGAASLVFFTGTQAAVWAWYCLCHGGRDPRALVAAGVACKAVRIASDLLWSTHVLMVPSLMGPMASRGIEVLAEAFMRPIAERVPMHLFLLMLAVEMPCVYALYRHFHSIFPEYWLRNHSLLRSLIFETATMTVMLLAELYWRREFRRWRRSDAAVGSARHGGGAAGHRHGTVAVGNQHGGRHLQLLAGGAAGHMTAVGKAKAE